MKIAVLMGFSYLTCKLRSSDYKLPGIVLDLYTAYHHAISIKCNRILVITDHADLAINKPLLDLMYGGEIDSNITIFFDILIKNHQLLEFITMENLDIHLKKVANDASRLFFYYSGHARDGMILLPKYRHQASYDIVDNESVWLHTINFTDLMESIVAATLPTARIFCVMDCCSSKGLFLPYKFVNTIKSNKIISIETKDDLMKSLSDDVNDVNGEYRLNSFNNCGWYGSRDIVCISAHSSSFSSHFGSKFTLELFKNLKREEVKTYTSLIFLLNCGLLDDESLFSQVNSSYPNSYIIQPWIKKEGTTAIEYNYPTHTIKILED